MNTTRTRFVIPPRPVGSRVVIPARDPYTRTIIAEVTIDAARALGKHVLIKSVAEYTKREIAKGNDPTRVLVDGSAAKPLDQVVRKIEVRFGNIDARPAMLATQRAIEGAIMRHTYGIRWVWYDDWAGTRRTDMSKPIWIKTGQIFFLHMSTRDDDVTKQNVEYKLHWDPDLKQFISAGSEVPRGRTRGFLSLASAAGRRAAGKDFHVAMRWTGDEFGKVPVPYNKLREQVGLKKTKGYKQGVPVFRFALTGLKNYKRYV